MLLLYHSTLNTVRKHVGRHAFFLVKLNIGAVSTIKSETFGMFVNSSFHLITSKARKVKVFVFFFKLMGKI